MAGILAAASFSAMTGLADGWPLNSTTTLQWSWTNTPTLLTAVDAELLLLRTTDCQPSFLAMDCRTTPWPMVQSRPCWPPVPMHTLKFFAATVAPPALAPLPLVLLLLLLLPLLPLLLQPATRAMMASAAIAPGVLYLRQCLSRMVVPSIELSRPAGAGYWLAGGVDATASAAGSSPPGRFPAFFAGGGGAGVGGPT